MCVDVCHRDTSVILCLLLGLVCKSQGLSGAAHVPGAQGMLSPSMYGRAKAALLSALVLAGAAVITAVVGFVMASPTFGWTGVLRPHRIRSRPAVADLLRSVLSAQASSAAVPLAAAAA